MAYHDENGKITIDEVAANSDIEKLTASMQKLAEIKAKFQQLTEQAGQSQGETATAIADKSSEMIAKLTKTQRQLEETIGLIRRTVAHYQQIDQALRDVINSTN